MNQIRRWQFTVDDFARMGEAGIFREGDRVELIDGEVRIMSPIGARHAGMVRRLNALLNRFSGFISSVQNPLQLSDITEPEPDVVLLRTRDDFYTESHPTPMDVLLLIEVADTSLEYDREEKVPRYAEADVPEVWLVDLERECITQYSEPAGSKFNQERVFQLGDKLLARAVPSLELSVDEVFGKRAK